MDASIANPKCSNALPPIVKAKEVKSTDPKNDQKLQSRPTITNAKMDALVREATRPLIDDSKGPILRL